MFASEVRELQQVERSPERAPDLVQVLRTTARDRLPAFEQAKRKLHLKVPDQGPFVVPGNGGRLARVIGNLIDNARRFAPEGSAVELEVRPGSELESLELHVLDRGPGVPEAARGRLFQRFSQVESPDSTGDPQSGTVGLGLYFCRSSVEAWGGQIGYSDRPGGGADFWIRLPVLVGDQ